MHSVTRDFDRHPSLAVSGVCPAQGGGRWEIGGERLGGKLSDVPSRSGYVLLVDSDEEYREALSRLLTREGHETREFGTGEETLEAARAERPALVVLEVSLPDTSGYTICRQLRDEFGDGLPIVFLSANRTESFDRMAGLLIGADEYLAKPCPSDEFVWRVQRLISRSAPASLPEPPDSDLSPRELEILGLLAQGLSQKQIAGELYLSPKTVNSHVERIYEKLDVHSRTQAINVARRDRLIEV
jgi:DNA-binding NarL/FixJ family response regulator